MVEYVCKELMYVVVVENVCKMYVFCAILEHLYAWVMMNGIFNYCNGCVNFKDTFFVLLGLLTSGSAVRFPVHTSKEKWMK